MKKALPYLLPAFTFILISSILLVDPNVTGFTILNQPNIIEIKTSENFFIPKEAMVAVTFNEQKAEIPVEEFILKTGEKYELTDEGYTGEHVYRLNVLDLGLNLEKKGTLAVEIILDGEPISRFEKEIT